MKQELNKDEIDINASGGSRPGEQENRVPEGEDIKEPVDPNEPRHIETNTLETADDFGRIPPTGDDEVSWAEVDQENVIINPDPNTLDRG